MGSGGASSKKRSKASAGNSLSYDYSKVKSAQGYNNRKNSLIESTVVGQAIEARHEYKNGEIESIRATKISDKDNSFVVAGETRKTPSGTWEVTLGDRKQVITTNTLQYMTNAISENSRNRIIKSTIRKVNK